MEAEDVNYVVLGSYLGPHAIDRIWYIEQGMSKTSCLAVLAVANNFIALRKPEPLCLPFLMEKRKSGRCSLRS